MSGRHSQRKGKRTEQRAALDLREFYPSAVRGLGQARDGTDTADVEGTPWWVEVKANGSPLAALAQAESATDGRPPLVLLYLDHDRRGAVVVARLADLLKVRG
jgi:hypothetical protein